ncbi:ATP-binding protein [Planctomycetota bacterium]
MDASFERRYDRLVREYVLELGEEPLAAAAALGRELVKADVPPEEIGELQEQALVRLAQELPARSLASAVPLFSAPLIELLMAYGLAFREHLHELSQVEERHRQSMKMEAIGQLAGGIAHDFNNQLGVILGCAQMLQSHFLKDDHLKYYADTIVEAAQHSAAITTQLLTFARKGTQRLIPLDVHHAIGEVVTILEHSLDKRIEVVSCLDAEYSMTIGDPAQIQNAILNVAINARDAMPRGGTLTFATEAVSISTDDAPGTTHGLHSGRYIAVSVTDTGVGMKAELAKRIFEPFFSTKVRGRGTGMGLSVVYGTVKEHQGAVGVQSILGRGTSLRILLPVAETVDVCERAGDAEIVRGTARILLADDEKHARLTTGAILRNLGYEIMGCQDGAEAVECYRSSWQEIDLVILGVSMPKLQGPDALLLMQRINPEVKAILTSGRTLGEESGRVLEGCYVTFMSKPFGIAQLSRTVAEALSK